MRLRVRTVRSAIHPSEIVVIVPSVDDPELHVVLGANSVKDDLVEIGYPVGERDGHWLVELPREADNGARRIWTEKKNVVESVVSEIVRKRIGYALPVREIADGMHPSETIAAIRNIDGGDDEAFLDRRSIIDGRIDVGFPVRIDESRNAALVQIGRELTTGASALWVPLSDLVDVDGLEVARKEV